MVGSPCLREQGLELLPTVQLWTGGTGEGEAGKALEATGVAMAELGFKEESKMEEGNICPTGRLLDKCCGLGDVRGPGGDAAAAERSTAGWEMVHCHDLETGCWPELLLLVCWGLAKCQEAWRLKHQRRPHHQ